MELAAARSDEGILGGTGDPALAGSLKLSDFEFEFSFVSCSLRTPWRTRWGQTGRRVPGRSDIL